MIHRVVEKRQIKSMGYLDADCSKFSDFVVLVEVLMSHANLINNFMYTGGCIEQEGLEYSFISNCVVRVFCGHSRCNPGVLFDRNENLVGDQVMEMVHSVLSSTESRIHV